MSKQILTRQIKLNNIDVLFTHPFYFQHGNLIGGVMVSVLASSAVDSEFEPRVR
jgi:hypothetical protein